jgi:hypothetical protein
VITYSATLDVPIDTTTLQSDTTAGWSDTTAADTSSINQ